MSALQGKSVESPLTSDFEGIDSSAHFALDRHENVEIYDQKHQKETFAISLAIGHVMCTQKKINVNIFLNLAQFEKGPQFHCFYQWKIQSPDPV